MFERQIMEFHSVIEIMKQKRDKIGLKLKQFEK